MVSHKAICRKLCIILFAVLLAPFVWYGTSTATETSINQTLPVSESQVPRISPEELKERLDKRKKL